MTATPQLPQVIDIVAGTSVDGPGLRTSIYFAGCRHQCIGCHNPQSWPMDSGHPMTIDEIVSIVDENGFNVTFSGGDPIYQAASILPLAQKLKQSGYNIWCYTGFMFEQLLNMPEAKQLLEYIDVLVDGPFQQHLRDTSLRFKGSSNQRIIDVAQTFHNEKVTLWAEEEECIPKFM